MNLQEVRDIAKQSCTKCHVCPICNGVACRGQVPGMGGKASGSTFIRNVEKLKEVRIQMDVIAEDKLIDTSTTLFGKKVSLPVYLAPIAGIKNNYGAEMTEEEYAHHTLVGAAMAGTIAFTGDGMHLPMFTGPLDEIDKLDGQGIATMKPWRKEGIIERVEALNMKNVLALATDIDSCGLPLLRNSAIPVENKSVEALKELKSMINVPLIIKGIMTKESALKALAAGADAIIVSNHGGRVMDDGLSTIEVLEEIANAVKGKMTVLVDSGFRTGLDVFKALALGADGVLIGRPLGLVAIGGQSEGVKLAFEQLQEELRQTMVMTGCHSISEITRDKVFVK